MGNLTPTQLERLFLRAVAAVNPLASLGEEDWWSITALQQTWPLDLGPLSRASLTGIGQWTTRKGMSAIRRAGQHRHATNYYAEYRATSFGRGLVADSCIGGGLPWVLIAGIPACPACLSSAGKLSLNPGEVRGTLPAHPLPGYLPATLTTTATGEGS